MATTKKEKAKKVEADASVDVLDARSFNPTFAELRVLEQKTGTALTELEAAMKNPSTDVLIWLVYVLKHRDDPKYGWKDAENESVTTLEDFQLS